MKVYMLKDVEKVGMAGQVVKVANGYASNFLIPRKLAMEVSKGNEKFFESRVKKVKLNKQVLSSKVSLLAERLRNMNLKIKKRTHNDGKLYGSINAEDIIELLKEKDVVVRKKQVEFPKNIKNIGDHKVIIKLSSKLKPELTLKVVS